MTNPENNWVHVSIKAANGTLFDARAEDGDTLAALVDGALGAGVYQGYVANALPVAAGTDPVLQQATSNVQLGGLAPASLPAPTPPAAPSLPAAGAQAAGGWQQSGQDKRELGVLQDGTKLAIQKGHFGWYINAYRPSDKWKLNANLPDGQPPETVDLNKAVEIVTAKMQKG